MECTNSATQRRTAWTENRHHHSGTLSVQQKHCSSPRNATSSRMSTGGGRGRLQVPLHRTPRRPAKTSWCRLCNQKDIAVTHGVRAAWYFTTYHDMMHLQLEHGRSMVLISDYAPTLLAVGRWQGSLLRLSWLHHTFSSLQAPAPPSWRLQC